MLGISTTKGDSNTEYKLAGTFKSNCVLIEVPSKVKALLSILTIVDMPPKFVPTKLKASSALTIYYETLEIMAVSAVLY